MLSQAKAKPPLNGAFVPIALTVVLPSLGHAFARRQRCDVYERAVNPGPKTKWSLSLKFVIGRCNKYIELP